MLVFEVDIASIFTIHFATINTKNRLYSQEFQNYLQYTLLLLIRKVKPLIELYFNHLQYTLLLLILSCQNLILVIKEYLQYTLLLLILLLFF